MRRAFDRRERGVEKRRAIEHEADLFCDAHGSRCLDVTSEVDAYALGVLHALEWVLGRMALPPHEQLSRVFPFPVR